jgi:alpha-amylase
MLYRFLFFCAISLSLFSCKKSESSTAPGEIVDGIPAFMLQGNIYEVNLRQYTEAGSFAAFAEHLPRLKEMGVQTLWFMPITPISVIDRKGSLGSYYAVQDYTGVNPEFGTMEDWINLVNKAHNLGFKVIIDWVANHTGADNRWLKSHPDFFVLDSLTKQPVYAFDWSDTRDLNYENTALADSMINAMKFWLTDTKIDGFRCDVAGEVPNAFWEKAIPELKKVKSDIIMLAEGERPSLATSGFQIMYPWDMFHTMNAIAAGKKDASYIDTAMNKIYREFSDSTYHMWFTSNHDENSWNKADYGTMPGESHAPFAVLTQTLSLGIPLIYSGQEEPHLDSLSFFYKDQIAFKEYKRAPFYQTLLKLRKENPALAANVPGEVIETGNPKQVYAFIRRKGDREVLVMVNLTNEKAKVNLSSERVQGDWLEVFSNKKQAVDAAFELNPYEYRVYNR